MTDRFTQEVSDIITMLEHENNLIRARNERLENEYYELEKRYDVLKEQCDLYKAQIGVESRRACCCQKCC
jgi:predicted nuclease with TOPRIM domain